MGDTRKFSRMTDTHEFSKMKTLAQTCAIEIFKGSGFGVFQNSAFLYDNN